MVQKKKKGPRGHLINFQKSIDQNQKVFFPGLTYQGSMWMSPNKRFYNKSFRDENLLFERSLRLSSTAPTILHSSDGQAFDAALSSCPTGIVSYVKDKSE